MGIEQYVLEKRVIIDNELNKVLSNGDILDEAAKYSILGPSHRWRPIVTLATAEVYKVPIKEILPVACAIEILHGLAIILDDLPPLDNGKLRRGKPTLHLAYGESSAILTSFYLTNPIESLILLKNNFKYQTKMDILQYFLKTKAEMVEGEYKDLQNEKKLSQQEILIIYQKKSGALYELSAVVSALAAQAPSSEIQHLAEYGKNMGIAYQILDDILDTESTPKEIGKDVEKDLGKPTLPFTIGVKRSREMALELIFKAKNSLEYLSEDTIKLRDLIEFICVVNDNKSSRIVDLNH